MSLGISEKITPPAFQECPVKPIETPLDVSQVALKTHVETLKTPRSLRKSQTISKKSHVNSILPASEFFLNMPQRDPQLDNQKKIDIIKKLRAIYECLMEVCIHPQFHITVCSNGFLELSPAPLVNPNESNADVHMHIYLNILNALNLKIYRIFDNEGHAFDIKMLADLAKKKFILETPIKNQVMQELELIKLEAFVDCDFKEELKSLPYPNTVEMVQFTYNEKICVRILQRLHPQLTPLAEEDTATASKIPIIPPSVFLATYKNFVKTDALLNLIKKTLDCSEKYMPLLQKIQLLNFTRMLINSFMFREEWAQHDTVIKEIVSIGNNLKIQEARHLCLEIMDLLNTDIHILKKRGITPLLFFFEGILTDKPVNEKQFTEYVDWISDDMKVIASDAISQLFFSQLFSEKESFVHYEKYGKNLTEFFLYFLVEKVTQGVKDINVVLKTPSMRIKIEFILRFGIHLMGASIKKHDLLSSYYLFFFLKVTLGDYFQTFKPQKKAIHLKIWKDDSKTLIALDQATFTIFKKAEILFSPTQGFLHLKHVMKEYQEKKLLFIPTLPITQKSLLLKSAGISGRRDSYTDSTSTNSPKTKLDIDILRGEASIILETELMLNNVLRLNKQGQLRTNFKSFLDMGFGL